MAVLRYVLDARGDPQPQIEHDPKRYMKGLPPAVYEVNLPPEHEGCALAELSRLYPCPPLAALDLEN
jgi:hypothetical protein